MKRLAIIMSLLTTALGFSPTYLSFNTGQISPLMEARIEFAKYRSSARTVENMLVTTQGPVFRRPGTKYIATQKDSTAIGRVISYEHSVEDSYVLLLEDQAMRFFRDGGQILDGVGTETVTGGDKPGTANLAAHWLLNEDEGFVVDNDNSAQTNWDGTATADTSILHATGKVGTGCFDFDNQYTVVTVDRDSFSFNNGTNGQGDATEDRPFSIACWAFITEQADVQVILSKWRNTSDTSEWRLSLTAERKLQLHLMDSGSTLASARIAHWKLNEDAANKIVLDEDASSHDGLTQTDNTEDLTATGKINACLNFGGSDLVIITDDDDELSFGDSTDDSAFSIAAWIFVTPSTVSQYILSKYDNTTVTPLREWSLKLDWRQRIAFIIYDNDDNASQRVTTDDPLDDGWHFVCATYDGSGGDGSGDVTAADGMTLYINNAAVAQSPRAVGTYTAMNNTATKVRISSAISSAGNTTWYFQDKIDSVMLFRTELTPADVSLLWNSGDGLENLGTGAEIFAVTDNAISTGWHFLTSTYRAPADESVAADAIIFYVDAAAVASTGENDDSYTAMQNDAEEVRFGSQQNLADTSAEKFWDDKIDEISLWSDVLTPTEIASLYSTTPYEIETPYLTADLFDLDFIKSEDVMYIAHPDYEPRQLSRLGHTQWSLDALNIGTGPFQAENEDTDLTITPDGTAYTAGSNITLTAASNLFLQGHVGSIWQISQVRGTSQVDGTFTENGHGLSTPEFSGAYGFTTSGNSDGTITLMRSTNGGSSWRPALAALTNEDFDNPAEIEEDNAIYRAVMSNLGSPGTDPTYTITITDNANNGVVRITGVENGTVAAAVVVTALVDGTATSNWREGYWSDLRGWPETVTIHQQRLTFGGSTTFPQTVWFGRTDPDDYTNFTEGTLDTSAFTAALPGNNQIQWLLSQDYLLIGNSGSCGKYGDQGKAVTPTSPNYQEQTREGAANLPGIIAGDAILYVERGSRKIREFVFDFQSDKYLSPDLSVLSPEITVSGIKDIAYQFRPYPILWCVLNNGDIATLTYQKNQSVVAWTKQITEGDFESITVIPDTTEDEVWVTVNRQIESTDARYVEQFQPQDWGSDDNDAWFVDSGASYDGVPEDEFTTGLDHLIGETVSIYADLLIESPEVVDPNGEIGIDNEASRVLVGMSYTSKLETMPIVIDAQDKAANKKIMSVWFDLYKTGYMEYGNGPESTLLNMNFNNNLDLDNTATAQDLVTSRVKLKRGSWGYGTMMKQTVYVESDQPMPLTVRSITPSFNLFGN